MLVKIATELGLNFSEKTISIMLELLEEGMSPENLAKLVREIEMKLEDTAFQKENFKDKVRDSED